MKERTAVVAAAGLGVLAIGGFFLLSREKNSFAPKVLGTRVLRATGGSPAYVEIDFEPSPALLKFAAEGETWEYRVAEPGGRIYLARINCDEHTRKLEVPYAYGRAPARPQIEVWIEGERRSSVTLETMPPPIVSPMATQSGSPIRAFHLSKARTAVLKMGDFEQKGGIRFVPTRPIQPKERWRVEVLRTPLQPRVINATTVYATYVPRHDSYPTQAEAEQAVARLYYAEDVTALRVRVQRLLHRTRSERLVLSGLRLVSRKGQTTVVWNRDRVPNSLGLDLRVVPDDLRYLSALQADQRAPHLPVQIPPLNGAVDGMNSDPWIDDETLMTIEGDDLKRLNVQSLSVGNATWSSKKKAGGTVSRTPFSVILTVTKQWDESLGSFEATIPVESAP